MYVKCTIERDSRGNPGKVIAMEKATDEQAEAFCQRVLAAEKKIRKKYVFAECASKKNEGGWAR